MHIVNSLKVFDVDGLLVPKTSILSKQIYSEDREEKYWQTIRHTITELLENMYSEGPNTVKLGQFLDAY